MKPAGLFLLGICLWVTCSVGCYQRTVAPTYSSESDTEVEKIRKQLGAITVNSEGDEPYKEFTNFEEESEEDE